MADFDLKTAVVDLHSFQRLIRSVNSVGEMVNNIGDLARAQQDAEFGCTKAREELAEVNAALLKAKAQHQEIVEGAQAAENAANLAVKQAEKRAQDTVAQARAEADALLKTAQEQVDTARKELADEKAEASAAFNEIKKQEKDASNRVHELQKQFDEMKERLSA